MLDPTPNPSTGEPIPRSPVHADAGLRLQFCRGDDDLTAHPGGDLDATEVRVWDGEVCLAAVTRERAGWAYSGGDRGHRIADEHLHARFTEWHEALHTLAGRTLPPT